MNKFDDLVKVEKTIDSCTTFGQVQVAERMASNWLKMYADLTPVSKLGRIRFDEDDHAYNAELSRKITLKRMSIR